MGKQIAKFAMWSRDPFRSKNHNLCLTLIKEEEEEIVAWCEENLEGDFCVSYDYISDNDWPGRLPVIIIDLPEDVMAAKLRWKRFRPTNGELPTRRP